MYFQHFLVRQMRFGHATFGPGNRREGVIDHIRKELVEVEEGDGDLKEWADVSILALDGLTRQIMFGDGDKELMTKERAALIAIDVMSRKMTKNEKRIWPDWRYAEPGKAIEHMKGT